jgi:hypothetical protein
MAAPTTPDLRLDRDSLADFISRYHTESAGYYGITLVKENGQGYNVVFHRGGAYPKTRIALTSKAYPDIVGSSWEVRDIIDRVLSAGAFPEDIKQIVDRTLMGSLGCVKLVVENGVIIAAHFHEGELWP